MRGDPSSEGFAFENLTVQRASRSLCELRGLVLPRLRNAPGLEVGLLSGGITLLRGRHDRGVDDLTSPGQEARLRQRRLVRPEQSFDRRIASIVARVSASRKVQIVLASGTAS